MKLKLGNRLVWFVVIAFGFTITCLLAGILSVSWFIQKFPPSQNEIPPSIYDLETLALTQRWNYEAESKIRRIVGSVANKLIIYTADNEFICLDIASGEVLWTYQAPGPITDLVTKDTFVLRDELLVFTSAIRAFSRNEVRIIVLEALTGEELWSLSDTEVDSIARSDFAVGDHYIYWGLKPNYIAFDRYTGEVIWRSTLPPITGGLLYDENNEVLVAIRPDIYILDANTGKIKRKLNITINSTPYKIDNGFIYVEKDETSLVKALDVQKDIVLWQQELTFFSNPSWSPLLRNNRVYIALNGTLGTLDAHTGEVFWEIPKKKGAVMYSNPAFTDDMIYTIFSDGSLRVFSDLHGQEIGRVEFGKALPEATLHITEQTLFVSVGSSNLYAYDFTAS